jgi:ComF family protein
MKIFERIKDIIYPRRAECMGCGSRIGMDSDDICDACRERLAKSCVGVKMPDSELKISDAAYALRYVSPAGGMVRKLKYSGVSILADEMAKDLAKAAGMPRLKDALVTFVPMHPRRERKRGFNHSELLARKAAERLGFECEKLLLRTRNDPQQARLSREERINNLKGAFKVSETEIEKVKDRNILLIDDVFTTGATAKSCAEALMNAGAAKVYFAAYAYGERS